MASKMAPDLMNQIVNEFGGSTLNRIASAIGVSPANTLSAVNGIVPAILGGLASKAATPNGATEIIDVIRNNPSSSIDVADITRPDAVAKLASTGQSFLDFSLGDKMSGVTEWIGNNTGISRASVASLAGICAPMILGQLARRLGSTGLSASGLTNLLGSPSRYLHSVPAGLVTALGLGGAATAARRLTDDYERRPAAAPAYVAKEVSQRTSPWFWLVPLLLGIGALGLLGYLLSRRQAPVVTPTERATVTAPSVPAPVLPTATQLGAFINAKLPNGVNLNIPSNGIENKLLAFINDPTKAVDKETWFSFDRLEFETDSAVLKPSSREQLSNIASIMKAYPQVDVKIGGYTDNTGTPAHNQKLSQDRANSTLNEIAAQGIDRSRLAAEGYGEQFPVADNSTPEGRQRNRRIDIRVTKK